MSDDAEIAERVISALEAHQRCSVETLEANESDPEAVVKALVRLHLEWTEEDPERAILISRKRNEVAAGQFGERLAASNREFFSRMKAWIDSQADAGRGTSGKDRHV